MSRSERAFQSTSIEAYWSPSFPMDAVLAGNTPSLWSTPRQYLSLYRS